MARTVRALENQRVTFTYELNGSYAESNVGPSLVPYGGMLGPTGYTGAATRRPSNILIGRGKPIEVQPVAFHVIPGGHVF
jgi:hypothetical protein